jgi:hypothetical protein
VVKPLTEIQPLLIQSGEIILYPNPANTNITVQLPETVEDDSDILIHDMMGILKLSTVIPAFEISEDINIESLPQGVYIVSIIRNGVLQKSISLLVIRN